MKSRISDKTRLKRGLGQGSGKDYNSYLRPRDFPSKGCTTRVFGHKLKKEHVMLSNGELDFFCFLDWDDSVTDIQEQIPLLPLSSTQQIAEVSNIAHPRNEKNEDVVMTTDFLVTRECDGKVRQIAFSVKTSSAISPRVVERFQIEREYWTGKLVPWYIVTEKQLNPIQLNNIKFLREYFDSEPLHASVVLEEFKKYQKEKELDGTEFLKVCACKSKTQFGDSCRAFYHLLATKRIWFDVKRNLSLKQSINNFKLYEYESNN